MTRHRGRKAGALALSVGVAVGANADTAGAAQRIVQTALNGGHLARGSAQTNRLGGSSVSWHWSAIRTTEIQNPIAFWDTICGYQGARAVVHLTTREVTHTINSAVHTGCTFGSAFFDFGERYLTDVYGVKTKWKSNHTTNDDWIDIGTLTAG